MLSKLDVLLQNEAMHSQYVFILTLATKIVDPSLPACRLLIISGGMFGLLIIEGGKFIKPGDISGPCPPV